MADAMPSLLARPNLHPEQGCAMGRNNHHPGQAYQRLQPQFFRIRFLQREARRTPCSAEEIPRIKKLRESKQLDHYMLFANRRLAGNAESEIRAYIAAQCGIPTSSIYLCGLEQLEILLKTFPDVHGDGRISTRSIRH